MCLAQATRSVASAQDSGVQCVEEVEMLKFSHCSSGPGLPTLIMLTTRVR